MPGVVDLMMTVPDAASIATARFLRGRTGTWAGGSTGTNLWGVCALAARMRAEGRRGSIVSLICDGGERYRHSYDDDAWRAAQGMDLAPYTATLERFVLDGTWSPPATRDHPTKG